MTRSISHLLLIAVAACGRIGFDAVPVRTNGSVSLAYPRTTIAGILDTTDVSMAPSVSTSGARYTIAPALPAGLSLDSTSGLIAGTPTQPVFASYVVTAAIANATAIAALDIVVLPGYVVDSTADAPDADAGADTTCATTAGQCTLRAAIQTTNHRTTRQLVLVDSQTYTLGSQLDTLGNDVVIAGLGATTTTIVAATPHAAYQALTLASAHTLALRDLAIDQFGGSDGGALQVSAGQLDVGGCNFSDNASPQSGGVLFVNGGAQAQFSRCTFVGNASLGGNGGGWGGVIDGEGTGTAIVVTQSYATQNTTQWGAFSHITTGTTLRLENSTLYGNTSATAGTLATPGGTYTLVNDTIVGNTNTNPTPDSAGLYLFQAPCHYTVTNTIVAFNLDVNSAEYNCNRRDLTTSLTSGGSNIFNDDAENCGMYFTMPDDRLGTDPGLAETAPSDHGGFTPTIGLAPGSPAIATGQPPACPPLDQRGWPRPPNAACDIGAAQLP